MTARNRSGLGVGQAVALTLGFLAASTVVFVLGIWVGKDMTENRIAREDRVIRRPVVRSTPPGSPSRDPDIKLFESLAEATSPTVVIAATATPVPPRHTPTRRAQVPVGAIASPTRPAEKPAAETSGRRGDEWADAGWTVQVSATTDLTEAEHLAERLRAKGYPAYTVQAPKRDRIWYRVRVGHFTTRAEAGAMERRLRTQEGMQHAYVTAR